jgi:hypothetical protein
MALSIHIPFQGNPLTQLRMKRISMESCMDNESLIGKYRTCTWTRRRPASLRTLHLLSPWFAATEGHSFV